MTIKDVAKICNVSTGTVNRALNNKPGIKPATKNRILHVVRELNYRPNYHARTLATGRTNTIGLVLPNVDNEFFAMLCSGVEKIGWETGFVMNLVLSNDNPEKETKALTSFLERGVEGIIVFPVSREVETIQRCVDADSKVVLLLNELPISSVSVVKVDDFQIMATTVEHLVRSGHRDIAYIDGYMHYSPVYNDSINRERYRGYRETLVKNHIMYDRENYLEFNPAWYDDNDFSQLERLLSGTVRRPTAIICFHDQIAVWVVRGLERLGLRVPEDISVAGVDNIRELRYLHPRLTTSELPVRDLAEKAVSLLIQQVRNPESNPERIILRTTFISGESVRDLQQPIGS